LFVLTDISLLILTIAFFTFEDPGHCTLTGTINDPKLWTAETPHLYILVISLYADMMSAEKGEGAIDVETCRVGVRDIQIAGGHCDVLCSIVLSCIILHPT
jgi:beta-galactosidase/beta-glucuronidase